MGMKMKFTFEDVLYKEFEQLMAAGDELHRILRDVSFLVEDEEER